MPLTKTLLYYWRMCATGLCFVTFMLGGLVLTLLVFPVISILPLSPGSTQRSVLLLIHWAFKLFMQFMQWLSPIEAFDIQGLENLQPHESYLFIANHPTLIDIVAIMSCVPCCTCIVKQSLWDHFSIGGVVRTAGYIVHGKSAQIIHDCQQCFQEKRSLIIFPEGTRSPAYGLHAFTRGAAHIALRTGVPVVPIVITYNNPTLLKGESWLQIPARPLRLTLHFHAPMVFPREIAEEQRFPVKVRALTQYFEAFFRNTLECDRHPSGV